MLLNIVMCISVINLNMLLLQACFNLSQSLLDRLNKYNHFMALCHPYSTEDVAKLFIDHVF